MSRTVVFTFDTVDAATEARAALKNLEKSHALALDDALVLVKDADGRLRRRCDRCSAIIMGAAAGGLMGLVLTFMFPVVSVVFGVVAGGLIGGLFIASRADKELVTDAEAALRPGMSALIILIRDGDLDALGAALCPFSVQLYETTLSPDREAALRRALQQQCQPIAEPARLTAPMAGGAG
jgi:uncharacterized membrane protein